MVEGFHSLQTFPLATGIPEGLSWLGEGRGCGRECLREWKRLTMGKSGGARQRCGGCLWIVIEGARCGGAGVRWML